MRNTCWAGLWEMRTESFVTRGQTSESLQIDFGSGQNGFK